MKEQLRALYELQTLDINITRIKAQIAALDGASALKRKSEIGKLKISAAEKELQTLETDLKDSELKLKSIDEKRITMEKRLYSGSNPKELSAIEKEIKSLKERQYELDGRVLELYDLVEKAREQKVSIQKIIDDIQARLKTALEKESTEKAQYESELSELVTKRDAAVEIVTDQSLVARYESVRKRTGNTGIAKVIHGQCEGCHVSITSFTLRNLFDAKELESCENCGRLLMLEIE